MACTRRSRDGTWAKKELTSYYGFKLHTIIYREHQLIWAQVTTSASVHDSRVDLSQSGKTVYRDKGYFGVKPIASMDKTMHRAVREHPVSTREKRRNRAIRRVRSRVERTYAVIKRQFNAGNVLVTTVARANLHNLFACFDYNLAQLRTIHRQALEER